MNQPSITSTTAPTTIADRTAALELLVQQLVLALDATGALDADELARWADTCAGRMKATGAATPGELAALAALRAQVLQ